MEAVPALTAWQAASDDHAADLARLAFGDSAGPTEVELARSVLRSWHVEVATDGGALISAVAVLPPRSGHHRGYGAWWTHAAKPPVLEHLKHVAATVAGLDVLQVSVPSSSSETAALLEAAGFHLAYPVWTMKHDGLTWPEHLLPARLRLADWAGVDLRHLHGAYVEAYRDQRLVEPHGEDAFAEMAASDSFDRYLSAAAVDADGRIVGFVLAFHAHSGGVELGPIATVPAWRGRGVSSALLSSVLARCRDSGTLPIMLTVDGDSPTGAHRLYERFGFGKSEDLAAYRAEVAVWPRSTSITT